MDKILISICLVGLIFVLIILLSFSPVQVVGKSMIPSYDDGAFLLNSKMIYHFQSPQYKDTVVVNWPGTPYNILSRIIAIPGDKVIFREEKIWINGSQLSEPYVQGISKIFEKSIFKEGEEITVPENEYLVLGDNREFSADSRANGFISRSNIKGKILFCYWGCSKR